MLGRGWQQIVGEVDVVLAGPPCQGHSNLNNHTRRTDLRNDLYLTVPAVAIALDAPVVIIENVPAVVHDRTGVVASTVTLFEEAGYTVEQGVLKADQMGWAQRRSRFFLIARRDAAPVPLDAVAAGLSDDARSVMWAIGDVQDTEHDEHMYRTPSSMTTTSAGSIGCSTTTHTTSPSPSGLSATGTAPPTHRSTDDSTTINRRPRSPLAS